MKRTSITLALMASLAACGDGQPFEADEATEDGTTTTGTTEGSTEGSSDIAEEILAEGTDSPPVGENEQARGDIVRQEPYDGAGGGVASALVYNADGDTFFVDGLAFDGLNTYQRFAARPQLGDAAVYRADLQVEDSLTGKPINQIIPHFALYDTSDATIEDGTRRTSYAIVRTGGYGGYGFGGYSYQRAGDHVLPTEGQATFTGTYAGLRVFDPISRIELSQADLTIDIDFDDFDNNQGLKGRLENRQYFNENGTPIETFASVSRDGQSESAIQAPDLTFVVREGGSAITSNGEIAGEVISVVIDDNGDYVDYETGNYYGILAGDMTDAADGGEIVGVLEFVADDSRPIYEGVTSQETGGFIATR